MLGRNSFASDTFNPGPTLHGFDEVGNPLLAI